ncbi:unnamed protein product [Cylicocyclus nassatus]|uniref:SCP domain-containing protein n=1 Tax=Cylicocyclus nassatus TaxID=53992 RepID=A0AA36H0H6_CYLNA|nr:unnamed protein product [Cylicocyclus nassatus]
MIKLKWDCNLEKEAIDKVRGCPKDVSNEKLKGELRHRVPVKDVQNYEDGIRNAVHNWWRVVRFNDGIGMKAIFRAKHVGQPIATFTQMAWAETRNLGCAIGKCSSDYVIIYRYNPAGNEIERLVYDPGNTCSSCVHSCDKENGLCIV